MIAMTRPRPPPPTARPPPRPTPDRPRTSVTADGSSRAFGSNVIGARPPGVGVRELYSLGRPGGDAQRNGRCANRLAGSPGASPPRAAPRRRVLHLGLGRPMPEPANEPT